MASLLPTGLVYSLRMVRWQLFGTLTFRTPIPSRSCRFSLVEAHFQRVAKSVGREPHLMLTALRDEKGEINGRPHFHYLLGGCPSVNNLHSFAAKVESDWRRETGCIASVRPYDNRQSGVAYCFKCLGYPSDLSGANLYETGKFRGADEVRLSGSVGRLLCAMRESDERAATADCQTQKPWLRQGSALEITEGELPFVAP